MNIIPKIRGIGLVIGLWLTFPDVTLACERCFGAGADSPLVSAIGLSMLSLLLLIGFVFGGIVSFFNQANQRAAEIARTADSDVEPDQNPIKPESDI